MDEYQTPIKYIRAAHEVMGSIDLDPFSSYENNIRIEATTFYDKERNGYKENWFGNIWCNPPYSKPNLKLATYKIIEESGTLNQAIYLIPDYAAKKSILERVCCFADHRIKFLLNGKIQFAPRFSNVFVYFGENHKKFAEVFRQFGNIVRPY